MTLTYSAERASELRANYQRMLEQVREAAQDHSGARNADSPLPELTVVTKFFPAEDVAALYDAGVRSVGENRDQEAGPKAALLASDHANPDDPLRWSFIGQLQTNKAKSVVKYAWEVQSVDRLSLAQALSRSYSQQVARWEAEEAPAPAALAAGGLTCLIQVGLGESATAGQAASGARGGADPAEVLALAEALESLPGLRVGGLMAVAPLGEDPNAAFERLYGISQELQQAFPRATTLSAGMSGDLVEAIRWGSTQVRIGSHIMGARPPHKQAL